MEFKDTGIYEIREYEGIKVLFQVGFGYDEDQNEEVHTIEYSSKINGIGMSKKLYLQKDMTALEGWSEFNSICGEGETIIDSHGLDHVRQLKKILTEFIP